MKIIVVCGAGASSAFVAVKLRSAAVARELEVEVTTDTAGRLDSLEAVDVVLVGAHLEAAVPALRARAAATGTAVAVLPPVSPAALDGAQALDLALGAAGAQRGPRPARLAPAVDGEHDETEGTAEPPRTVPPENEGDHDHG